MEQFVVARCFIRKSCKNINAKVIDYRINLDKFKIRLEVVERIIEVTSG